MAITSPMQDPGDVDEWEKDVHDVVEKQRTHSKRWDLRGQGAGLW